MRHAVERYLRAAFRDNLAVLLAHAVEERDQHAKAFALAIQPLQTAPSTVCSPLQNYQARANLVDASAEGIRKEFCATPLTKDCRRPLLECEALSGPGTPRFPDTGRRHDRLNVRKYLR